jgi:hypothetical protein
MTKPDMQHNKYQPWKLVVFGVPQKVMKQGQNSVGYTAMRGYVPVPVSQPTI